MNEIKENATKGLSTMKNKRIKAQQLTLQKQKRIAKFKESHPEMTYSEVAAQFNCTYDQVRYAHLRYLDGKLNRIKPRFREANVEDVKKEFTPDELLERQYHQAIAQLESEKRISTEERIMMLEKLTGIRKILQQIKLENFLKRADAGIITMIIRKFKSDADDEEIKKIYLSAVEQYKLENK